MEKFRRDPIIPRTRLNSRSHSLLLSPSPIVIFLSGGGLTSRSPMSKGTADKTVLLLPDTHILGAGPHLEDDLTDSIEPRMRFANVIFLFLATITLIMAL